MNIEVGEYIRTKNGVIAQLEYIHDKDEVYWFDKVIYSRYDEEIDFLTTEELPKYIVNHSKNIIDLIEVGDFVKIEYFSNRYSKRVKRIFEVDCIIDKSVCFTNGYYTLNILNGEWANQDKEVKPIIKSIVTKEQFSNMEYRL